MKDLGVTKLVNFIKKRLVSRKRRKKCSNILLQKIFFTFQLLYSKSVCIRKEKAGKLKRKKN